MAFNIGDFIAASAGGAAAASSTVALYPIDIIKTNINRGHDSSGAEYTSNRDVVTQLYAKGGLAGFYRGISARTTQQIVQKFSFYYCYAFLRRSVGPRNLTFWPNLLVGYLAGVGSVLGSNPLEVVSTRQQTSGGPPRGTLATVMDILAESGAEGLFRGCTSNFVLAINPAIENTLFDQIKALFLRRWSLKILPTWAAFWLGALAKTIATALTFPFIRAKVLQMAASASKDGAQVVEKTSHQVLTEIVQKDGFLAMWNGMTAQSVKAVLSSALLLASKEKIEVAVRVLILAVLQSKRQSP